MGSKNSLNYGNRCAISRPETVLQRGARYNRDGTAGLFNVTFLIVARRPAVSLVLGDLFASSREEHQGADVVANSSWMKVHTSMISSSNEVGKRREYFAGTWVTVMEPLLAVLQ